jgi:hypothetical protein
MAVGKSAPALRRVGGLIIMLIGAGLVAWGAHYLAINGTCSSTGYVSYGPVPTCHGPEGLYITATFFGGPFVMLIGWGMARIPSVLWPVFCVFLATSFASIDLDKNESSGAHTFGLVLGAAFLALALFSVVTTVRKRLAGPPPAPQPNPAMAGMYAAPDSAADGASSGFTTVTPFTPAVPAAPPASTGPADPLDKIAKLAKLRDSGALTNEEFEREKAKLLAQM